jgi:hypothetical protein
MEQMPSVDDKSAQQPELLLLRRPTSPAENSVEFGFVEVAALLEVAVTKVNRAERSSSAARIRSSFVWLFRSAFAVALDHHQLPSQPSTAPPMSVNRISIGPPVGFKADLRLDRLTLSVVGSLSGLAYDLSLPMVGRLATCA